MNENQFEKTERREISDDDFAAALSKVLLAPRTDVRSENREPTKAEIEARYRLDRNAKS